MCSSFAAETWWNSGSTTRTVYYYYFLNKNHTRRVDYYLVQGGRIIAEVKIRDISDFSRIGKRGHVARRPIKSVAKVPWHFFSRRLYIYRSKENIIDTHYTTTKPTKKYLSNKTYSLCTVGYHHVLIYKYLLLLRLIGKHPRKTHHYIGSPNRCWSNLWIVNSINIWCLKDMNSIIANNNDNNLIAYNVALYVYQCCFCTQLLWLHTEDARWPSSFPLTHISASSPGVPQPSELGKQARWVFIVVLERVIITNCWQ